MADWTREFDEPIPVPKGRRLVTLRDAGDYVAKLPKAKHMTAEWQAAMLALMLVVDLNGPTMMARIGIMRALNRHTERVFNSDRKDKHWGNGSSSGTNELSPLIFDLAHPLSSYRERDAYHSLPGELNTHDRSQFPSWIRYGNRNFH